jgi:hypothetical protein
MILILWLLVASAQTATFPLENSVIRLSNPSSFYENIFVQVYQGGSLLYSACHFVFVAGKGVVNPISISWRGKRFISRARSIFLHIA